MMGMELVSSRRLLLGDYMRRTHNGEGIVLFPLAAIGRGVQSMVIACVLGSNLGRLGCFTTDEESVGLDYE